VICEAIPHNRQSSAGIGVSLCIPPFCYGASSGSVSMSDSKAQGAYASVAAQSGIRAGDGGFDIEVHGDTTLKGGVIASTQAAVDTGRNHFETGGELTFVDLDNRAAYEAEGYGVTIGVGANVSLSGAGIGSDKGSSSGITQSGIAGIAGKEAIRTGGASGGIAQIFDADKVQREINAQVTITQEFGQRASMVVKDYATAQRKARYEQLKQAGVRGQSKNSE